MLSGCFREGMIILRLFFLPYQSPGCVLSVRASEGQRQVCKPRRDRLQLPQDTNQLDRTFLQQWILLSPSIRVRRSKIRPLWISIAKLVHSTMPELPVVMLVAKSH